MGLVQAAIEREGIPTVSLSMLPEVTERVQPPRTLVVPYPLGYPLGNPGDPETQIRILLAALALLERRDLPVLEKFGYPRQGSNLRPQL